MEKQAIHKNTIDIVVVDFLKSIKNNRTFEFILYIPTIVLVTIVAIVLKPNKLTLFIVAILSISYISILLSHAECKKATSKENVFFLMITFCFTLLCILFYYGINTIYWSYTNYHSLLLLTPIIYFIFIKVLFYSLECNEYTNYNFGIDIIIIVLTFLFKIININL